MLAAVFWVAGAAACGGRPVPAPPPPAAIRFAVNRETPSVRGDEMRSEPFTPPAGTAVVRLRIVGEVRFGGLGFRFEDAQGLVRPTGVAGRGLLFGCVLAVRPRNAGALAVVLSNPFDGVASRWALDSVAVETLTEAQCPGCARRLEKRFDLASSPWPWAAEVLRRPVPRGGPLPWPECACAGPGPGPQPR